VRDVTSNSAQTLRALRVLRAHGMPDEALQIVFQPVIVGRLLERGVASSPPLTASKSTPSSGIVKCSRFCSPDLASYDDPLAEADTRLFSRISTNRLHVLYDLLLPPSTALQLYSLRERSHHFSPLTLPIPTSSPDASSTMLTNSLVINNYYNYMTYFSYLHKRRF